MTLYKKAMSSVSTALQVAPSLGDLSLRVPTPADNYRCPVSTPANNYVQRQGRIRRTKPMAPLFSQPNTAGRSDRSIAKGLPSTHNSNNQLRGKQTLKTGKSLDYYFVDKNDDKHSESQINTFWLKALVAQPVEEILKKYRRKSEAKRTRIIWSKTFTTPGERTLLNAWGCNHDQNSTYKVRWNRLRSPNRTTIRKSHDYAQRPETAENNKLASPLRSARKTYSEPPMSRAHDLEIYSGSVTPARQYREDDICRHSPHSLEIDGGVSSRDKIQQSHSPNIFLSANDQQSRVKSYTTQYFKTREGPRITIKTRVVPSPQMLPYLNSAPRLLNVISDARPSKNDMTTHGRCES